MASQFNESEAEQLFREALEASETQKGAFKPDAFQARFDAKRPGTALANFNNLFLTKEQIEEAGFGNKKAFKLFGKSPLDIAKKRGDDNLPVGLFVEFSNEALANELLAREGGNPGSGALSQLETGSIFSELRNRNELNKPAPPPQDPGAAFRVGEIERRATNLDRQAEGLTPLLTPLSGRSLGSRPPRGSATERRILAELDGPATPRRSLIGQAATGRTTTTTSPDGEALRRANAEPVRLGSAPNTSPARR